LWRIRCRFYSRLLTDTMGYDVGSTPVFWRIRWDTMSVLLPSFDGYDGIRCRFYSRLLTDAMSVLLPSFDGYDVGSTPIFWRIRCRFYSRLFMDTMSVLLPYFDGYDVGSTPVFWRIRCRFYSRLLTDAMSVLLPSFDGWLAITLTGVFVSLIFFIRFYTMWPLTCSDSELILKLWILVNFLRLLGRDIDSSHDPYGSIRKPGHWQKPSSEWNSLLVATIKNNSENLCIVIMYRNH
jgi:hypothetical protein